MTTAHARRIADPLLKAMSARTQIVRIPYATQRCPIAMVLGDAFPRSATDTRDSSRKSLRPDLWKRHARDPIMSQPWISLVSLATLWPTVETHPDRYHTAQPHLDRVSALVTHTIVRPQLTINHQAGTKQEPTTRKHDRISQAIGRQSS